MASGLGLSPTEVLSSITSFLNAFDITRLWFCGDSKLNYRLRQAVFTFDLEYVHIDGPSWPHIIKYFARLHHLRVVLPAHVSWAMVDHVDLSTIPWTIKSIKLAFGNEIAPFFQLFDAPIASGEKVHVELIDMASRFPNLEEFVVAGTGPGLRSAELDPLVTLRRLPQHLRMIQFPPLLPDLSKVIDFLPRTMTRLDIPLLESLAGNEHKIDFPPFLTYLRITNDSPVAFDAIALIPQIPKTVVDLILVVRTMLSDNRVLDFSSFPNLRKLNVGCSTLSTEMAALLPRGLKTLNLSMNHSTHSEALAKLPRSLTELTAVALGDQEAFVGDLTTLPPSLVYGSLTTFGEPENWKFVPNFASVSIENDVIDKDDLKNFPKKAIHVDCSPVVFDTVFPFLPPTVTNLKIEVAHTLDELPSHFPTLELISAACPLLVTLSTMCTPKCPLLQPQESSSLGGPVLIHLRHLNVSCIGISAHTALDWTDQRLIQWMPSLQRLKLNVSELSRYASFAGNPEMATQWFRSLPRTLTELSYYHPVRRLRDNLPDGSSSIPATVWQVLPPLLTKLIIEDLIVPTPLTQTFANLPKSLTNISLYLSHHPSFPPLQQLLAIPSNITLNGYTPPMNQEQAQLVKQEFLADFELLDAFARRPLLWVILGSQWNSFFHAYRLRQLSFPPLAKDRFSILQLLHMYI